MEKDDLIFRKFTAIHKAFEELELAVGVVFLDDVKPCLTSNILSIKELPFWDSGNGSRKIYLPRVKGSGENKIKGFNFCFFVPIYDEAYGEIVFRRDRNKKTEILFGRNGEEGPFGFGKRKEHLSLRIYRHENAPQKDWRFNPVFILIEDRLIKLSLQWIKDEVIVSFPKPSDYPSFFRA